MLRNVIYKLLGFTAAMFALPIGMYFVSINAIFGGKAQACHLVISSTPAVAHAEPGNATFAGITAAVTANLVLFAYIYVAWKEDQGDRQEAEKSKSKKAQ